MRLNANQLRALFEIMEEGDFFHIDLAGCDPLDRRLLHISLWSFDYDRNRFVAVDENGTVFDRPEMKQFIL